MTQIIVVSPHDIEKSKGLVDTMQQAYNSSHWALDKLIAVKIELGYGQEFNRDQALNTINDAIENVRHARALNGHIMNHLKGSKDSDSTE